jgi:hypothetical protein
MDWTVADYHHANHNPVLEVNGQSGTSPILIDVEVGKTVLLDASHSQDPDGQNLRYNWFHYSEAGVADGDLAAITIAGADTPRAIVTATAVCRPKWLPTSKPCSGSGRADVILSVTDDGSPPLTSYRRVVLNVRTSPAHEKTD